MSNSIPAFVVFTNEGFKFTVPANDIKMVYQSKENILVGDVEEEVVKTVVTLCDALGEEAAHYVDESFEDCCKLLNARNIEQYKTFTSNTAKSPIAALAAKPNDTEGRN